MNLDDIKKSIQSVFTDGITVIIGSGLSCSEGLPSMKTLANHLSTVLPSQLTLRQQGSWKKIASLLSNDIGLEQALTDQEVSPDLYSIITIETARLIRNSERKTISDVLTGKKTLRFTSLTKAFPPSPTGIALITTNYDRLVEIACDVTGHNVDTMFTGSVLGRLDPQASAFSFCRGIRRRQGKIVLEYAPRYRIFKPHGSLDWYTLGGKPIRCTYDLDESPLIIAPGSTKYRAGYDEPFDINREQANKEIDRASKYLIIGYGFNDDHLQVHLSRNLREGKQCLIVTKELSPAAQKLIADCPNVLALTGNSGMPSTSLFRYVDGTVYDITGELWDIEILTKEVL